MILQNMLRNYTFRTKLQFLLCLRLKTQSCLKIIFSWNFTWITAIFYYTYAATFYIFYLFYYHTLYCFYHKYLPWLSHVTNNHQQVDDRVLLLFMAFFQIAARTKMSSNEIYDCVRRENYTFFYWVPIQINISQRYIFQTTTLLNGILQSHLYLLFKVDWYFTS